MPTISARHIGTIRSRPQKLLELELTVYIHSTLLPAPAARTAAHFRWALPPVYLFKPLFIHSLMIPASALMLRLE